MTKQKIKSKLSQIRDKTNRSKTNCHKTLAKKYFNFKLPQNCGKINTMVEIATTIESETKTQSFEKKRTILKAGISTWFLYMFFS